MIIAWIGILLGIASIIVGAMLEGLHLVALVQPTAALIVFGGTLGATMLSANLKEFAEALKMAPNMFIRGDADHSGLIQDIIKLANVARKEGIIALDGQLSNVTHPFLKRFLRQVVDGYDPEVLKNMMDEAIDLYEEERTSAAKLWETAGGFSPTIGIIGAVLGLIHVMGNLSDSSKLGSGIAVAFVATVYGVGAANLILIPMGNRLKKIVKRETMELLLIQAGLVGILNGLNPRVIEDQLYNIMGASKPDEGANVASMDTQEAA